MQINVTGHHVEVSAPLRDYVLSKMEKVVRHCDDLTDARCILTVEKLRHKAEATLYVAGGSIYAEYTAGDMYAAIDGLVDRLDRRVKKHRDKLTDHHPREAHRQRLA
jgi:putative sigma-54 modulation protein